MTERRCLETAAVSITGWLRQYQCALTEGHTGPHDATNAIEDERITDMLRDRYPGYLYDGRDGDIEEEDDEGRIEAEDLAREGWQDYLAWQETSH